MEIGAPSVRQHVHDRRIEAIECEGPVRRVARGGRDDSPRHSSIAAAAQSVRSDIEHQGRIDSRRPYDDVAVAAAKIAPMQSTVIRNLDRRFRDRTLVEVAGGIGLVLVLVDHLGIGGQGHVPAPESARRIAALLPRLAAVGGPVERAIVCPYRIPDRGIGRRHLHAVRRAKGMHAVDGERAPCESRIERAQRVHVATDGHHRGSITRHRHRVAVDPIDVHRRRPPRKLRGGHQRQRHGNRQHSLDHRFHRLHLVIIRLQARVRDRHPSRKP